MDCQAAQYKRHPYSSWAIIKEALPDSQPNQSLRSMIERDFYLTDAGSEGFWIQSYSTAIAFRCKEGFFIIDMNQDYSKLITEDEELFQSYLDDDLTVECEGVWQFRGKPYNKNRTKCESEEQDDDSDGDGR